MKKRVALFLAVIACVCFSAHSTISTAGNGILNHFFLLGDTIKTVASNDSLAAAVNAISFDSWRGWKTVDNFAYGKDRGQIPMITDLESLHPYFRDRVIQLIKNCKAKGIELAIVESYRTHAKQSEYYSMGRKYTRSAGGKSKHQYGLAVDLVPVIDSVAQWDNVSLWRKVGVEGEKLGLRWGGRWKSPYDPAHFEWSGGLTTMQLSSGALPPIPTHKKNEYPCIQEDISELQAYWDLWEMEQRMMLKRVTATKQHSLSANHKH